MYIKKRRNTILSMQAIPYLECSLYIYFIDYEKEFFMGTGTDLLFQNILQQSFY